MAAVHQRTAFATASVVGAVVAFFVAPVLGFFLGLFAVVVGALAVLRAASSRRSGTIAGILGMGLGAVAAVVKVLQGALHLIF